MPDLPFLHTQNSVVLSLVLLITWVHSLKSRCWSRIEQEFLRRLVGRREHVNILFHVSFETLTFCSQVTNSPAYPVRSLCPHLFSHTHLVLFWTNWPLRWHKGSLPNLLYCYFHTVSRVNTLSVFLQGFFWSSTVFPPKEFQAWIFLVPPYFMFNTKTLSETTSRMTTF